MTKLAYSTRHHLLLTAAVGLPLIAGSVAYGQTEVPVQSSSETAGLHLGINSRFKLGHWTVIFVDREPVAAKAGVGTITVTVPDDEGTPCAYVTRFEIAESPLQAYVRVGRLKGQISVEMNVKGAHTRTRNIDIDQLARPLRNSQQHVLVLGGKSEVAAAFKMKGNRGEEVFVSHVASSTYLPSKWYGYDGIDAIILLTTDVDFYRQLNREQREAIRSWVAQGGRVLVSCGENAKTLLMEDSLLAEITDLRFVEVSPLRQTTGIEAYVGASQRLDMILRNTDHAASLQLAAVEFSQGRVELGEGEDQRTVPIALRQAYAFGHVMFVAVDLDNDLLRYWSGHAKLVSKLLHRTLGNDQDTIAESDRGQLTHLGFDDLSGQLHISLEQFTGVRLVPFSWIATLAVVYITIIGPMGYFALKRFGGHLQATWVLLPVVIFGVCLVAVALGNYWKGSESVANKLDLVDVDITGGLIRGTTWAHLYSAEGKTCDVKLQPPVDLQSVTGQAGNLLSWHGLAGDSFGGMAHPGLLARTGFAAYDNSIQKKEAGPIVSTIEGMPMPRWSSRALVDTWWSDGNEFFENATVGAESLQESDYGQLTGSLQNLTPWKWQNTLLLFGRWYYNLGTIESKQVISFADGPVALNLPTLLGRRKIVETKGVTTPWKKESMNLSRIMEMVMLHDTAGGRGYTNLLHRQQRCLDATPLLQAGRAVVLARTDDMTTQLQWDGKVASGDPDSDRTYLRVIFPVNLRN